MDHRPACLVGSPLLGTVVRRVSARYRIRSQDAADFSQFVMLSLLAGKIDAMPADQPTRSADENRACLSRYLFQVVRRLAVDWLRKAGGRWRPSAAARRLGRTAEELERLIVCDGLTSEQAVDELLRCAHAGLDRSTLERALGQIRPHYLPRAICDYPIDALQGGDRADSICRGAEAMHVAARLRAVLRVALTQLTETDRCLLRASLRAKSTASLARFLGLPAKATGRHLAEVRRRLREALVTAGLTEDDYAFVSETRGFELLRDAQRERERARARSGDRRD